VLIHGLLLLCLSNAMGCPRLLAQSAAPPSPPARANLTIGGDVQTRLSLTREDLLHMPRKTLKVMNPHENKEETYEGVLLPELLKRAGVPQGAQLRGAAMATYVQADAADGYRVIFSLAELDADFQDSEVIVADTMNGTPLDDKTGPFRLVAAHDKRPARWIKNAAITDGSPRTKIEARYFRRCLVGLKLSFVSQRYQRIDSCRTAGGQPAS
jgi:DMSO/TMAO reductase YedYZ molybdopterin-dependent catalytic subunit